MVKPGELRGEKYAQKLDPEVIALRIASEKERMQKLAKSKQSEQAEIMRQVGKILDEYGVAAHMRFVYTSFASRLIGKIDTISKPELWGTIKTYEWAGANAEILGKILELFGVDFSELVRWAWETLPPEHYITTAECDATQTYSITAEAKVI